MFTIQKSPAKSPDKSQLYKECCICIQKIRDGQQIYELDCGHILHIPCLEGLKKTTKCGFCL